ncbi:hypothetical protein P2318_22265 [Myxococcaceae bacterium GXIMD 01537]
MRLGLASWVALAGAVWVACSPPPPATLEFVDQSPAQPKLGEITTLRFRAVDSRGGPQPGTPVTFALQSAVPGVELTPTETTTNPSDGIASTQIIARGGRVASVVVVATSADKTAISPVISFAGAGATARQLTFQCGEFSGAGSGGVHAIGAYDDSRYLIAGVKVKCTAHVADRNGDGIGGAQVSFITEAGTIGPSSVSNTDVVGNATVLYKTSLPLPQDVDPGIFTWSPTVDATHTGEYLVPLWMNPFLWVQNPIRDWDKPVDPKSQRPEPQREDPIRPGKINNPRDNLVSMIAVTSGEESFDDNNNNGQWDANEPFSDLTEPFVDNNDNGTWDAGERFVDVNGNGVWDGKNGKYDAATLIWVQERILWTGVPHGLDRVSTVGGREALPVIRQVDPLPPAGSDVATINLAHFGSDNASFVVADPWFNSIARNSENDGCDGGAIGPVNVNNLSKFRAMTYPSFTLETYVISDQHDPKEDPPPPPYAAPVAYSVEAGCQFSAAADEGHKVFFSAPKIIGTVL